MSLPATVYCSTGIRGLVPVKGLIEVIDYDLQLENQGTWRVVFHRRLFNQKITTN